MHCRVLLVQNRSSDKIDLFISSCKLFQVRRFCQEIHLISCNRPHFIKHKIKIRHSLDTHRRHKFYSFMEKINIARHLLIDAPALNLHYYILSASQNRPVNLSNRSRALRLFFYGSEHSLP